MSSSTDQQLASRDPRQLLSKSFMVGADLCGQRAWLDLHDPRPFHMTEKVAFGKAVDLGVQIILAGWEAGLEMTGANASRLTDPLLELLAADATEPAVDIEEVLQACGAFRRWMDATELNLWRATRQHHIRVPVDGIGMVDAHPDLILQDGTIIDVKTSSRSKPLDAAATSWRELAFYALIRQIETGQRPPRVAYLTWVRSTRSPGWQYVEAEVTDRMLRIAHHHAASVARAIAADGMLNEGAAVPQNHTFATGPRFAGLCGDCSHNPARGGACTITEGD